MKRVDDFRLRFGKQELVPIIIGGMGVDISTAELALEVARLGGIGHISDAMVQTVSDRRFDTSFVSAEAQAVQGQRREQRQIGRALRPRPCWKRPRATTWAATMEAKRGDGMIFINCMEKLTMNAPRETLRVRLSAALDAGIDGITLSAGLHLGSFALIEDHPRFRDAKLGIIVSSPRALALFLRKNAKLNRLPDYIVVEGPLAGGHLGFGMDWAQYDLRTIVAEVLAVPEDRGTRYSGDPGRRHFHRQRCRLVSSNTAPRAVQVATRFTVARECGLPDKVKQEYFKASEDDIEVNTISPTGYPMRMLKNSPGIGAGIRPNCEAYGYLLDANGNCAYIDAYNREVALHPEAKKISVKDKTCLCTHMRNFDMLDLRPLHLPPQGHHPQACRTAATSCSAPNTSSTTTSSAPTTRSRCRTES